MPNTYYKDLKRVEQIDNGLLHEDDALILTLKIKICFQTNCLVGPMLLIEEENTRLDQNLNPYLSSMCWCASDCATHTKHWTKPELLS